MSQHMHEFQTDLSASEDSLTAIVLGTGRCGSTLLSNILREHPSILSLSEFFRLLNRSALQAGKLDAAQFWELIGAPDRRLLPFLQQKTMLPEFLYPYNLPSSRFHGETGIPPILLVTLPHLTDDYETLYDELREVVQSFPTDMIEKHYERLFSWLKQRFGRSVCVERSGLSLPIAASLIELFPRAKFIHLTRDGRTCAWSMSHHAAFRMVVALEKYQAMQQSETSATNGQKDPPSTDRSIDITQLQSLPLALCDFGTFWSRTIIAGVQALTALPEKQVLTMSYEELSADPQRNLTRLANFIEPSLDNTAWLPRAAALIRYRPSGWEQLPLAEQEALELTCRPGQVVLECAAQEGLHGSGLQRQLQEFSNLSYANQ